MLRVTIELVPFGSEVTKRTIGVMHIGNIGGKDGVCDYSVAQMHEQNASYANIIVSKIQRDPDVFKFLKALFAKL